MRRAKSMRGNLSEEGSRRPEDGKATSFYSSLLRQRQEHRDLMTVLLVRLAVYVRHVALFELKRDEDVCGRGDGEDEVADRHARRGPERDDEPEHDGMADDLVEKDRPESEVRVLPPALIHVDLPESEEVEVVYEERAEEHKRPADEEERPEDVAPRRVFNAPHRVRQRSPLPEEQYERKACEQNIRAALDRLQHVPRPPALEPLAGHFAVLNGDHAKHHRVNQQRLNTKRGVRAGVYRLRHHEMPDEAD